MLQNGLEIPVRHVTQIRGAREFMISLENDMIMGNSYMITKPGFRIGAVAYGMLYDTQEFEDRFTYTGMTWEQAGHLRKPASGYGHPLLPLYMSISS